MGTADSRPFASNSDGVRALCTRCGKTWPAETMSCSACGAELGGETVLDDVHARETTSLGGRRVSATTLHADTTTDAQAFRGETPTKTNAPSTRELPTFAEPADDEIGHITAEVPPRPRVADPLPMFGSSSDPPTRFLRGFDQHIDLPSGSVVDDDYEIDAKLGAGAMGVVYSARHVKLGRRVALKAIAPSMGTDPQALARFEREARTLGSMRHPNIVDVYSFGTLPDERTYFTMELLSGATLDERLERGRVSLDEGLDILDQMAAALEAAHAQGIVHRDLKPSNTFLVPLPDDQRRVVLLDFGLVRLAVSDGVEQTASGAMVGTALYISPEQARSPNVDGRTDVYALGVVAYELVLGRHPFWEARTPTAAIAAHLTEEPPQPRTIWPEIPAALDLLMHAMLAKDASYRPTLAQVRSVIGSVRSPTTTEERAGRAATAPVTRSALYARAWIAVAVVCALVVGIAIGASANDRKPRRGGEPQAEPARFGATKPTDRSAASPPVTTDPPAAAVVVPDPVVDASVAPAQAPTTETAKVLKRKPRVPAARIAPGVLDAAPPIPPADVGLAYETNPSSVEPTTAKPEVVSPPVTPTAVEKPVQRPMPPPRKPPGRDDTINPFVKHGSAAR